MANLERGLYLIPDSTTGFFTRYEYDNLHNNITIDGTTGSVILTKQEYKNTITVFNTFIKDVENQLRPSLAKPLNAWKLEIVKEKDSTSEPDSIVWKHEITDLNGSGITRVIEYNGLDTITINPIGAQVLNWVDFRNIIEQNNFLVQWINAF